MEAPGEASALAPFSPATVARAAALIAGGGIVAVPTETVYGLAADATDGTAVARIYAAKGRPAFNPLIVHVLDLAAAERLAAFDDRARALAIRFWPGPLTLVLPLRPEAGIASLVTAGLDTVAIRVPAHRAMRALLAATHKPLAAPSANRSGAISPTRAAHVLASLGSAVPLVIDDGPSEAGLESTIVQGEEVLRPGPITAEMLAALLASFPGEGRSPGAMGDESEDHPFPSDLTEAGLRPWAPAKYYFAGNPSPGNERIGTIVAPGQLASHYAPRKPLRLDVIAAHPDEWLIGFGAIAGDDTLSGTGDLTEAATRLFDALHRADASPRPRIAVAAVPAHGLGAAINDRLRRAAHR